MRSCAAWAVAVFAASIMVVGGCGSGGAASTEAVTGTVTYNGAPVADASVTFTPEKGRPATGITDAGGKFTLTTNVVGDGAVAGKHKVSIAPNASQVPPMPGTPEAAAAAAGKPPFPPRYSNPETSGLTADVKEGGGNDFTFGMTD
jgi:hypothetical protein